MAGLHFVQTGDNSQLLASLNQSKAAMEQLSGIARESGSSVDEALGKMKNFVGTLTGISVGVVGIKSFVSEVINVRSEMQNTEAAFKVFLGDAQKAASFTQELQTYAFNNVFEFSDLTQAASQLLAYKTSAEEVIPVIDQLSNVAAGTNKPLMDLVQVFNKIKSTDKIESEQLLQLQNMGIDVQQVIADMEGVSKSMVDKTSLKFKDLQAALAQVTGEGGMYAGMMDEKMKTLGDSIGLLQDSITNMYNEIGQETQGVLKTGIDLLNSLVENWREVATVLGGVIAVYGGHRAAMALNKVAYDLEIDTLTGLVTEKNQEIDATLQQAVAKGQLSQEQAEQINALRQEAAAQLEANKAKLEAATADYEAALKEEEYSDSLLSSAEEAKSAAEMNLIAAEESGDANAVEAAKKEVATATTEVNTAAEIKNSAAKNTQAAAAKKAMLSQQVETATTKANTIALTQNSVASKVAVATKNALNVATKILNKTMLGNPYALAAMAIMALCKWLYELITSESAQEAAARKLSEAHSEMEAGINSELVVLDAMFTRLEKAKEGTREYELAKQAINDKYGEYLKNQEDEIKNLEDIQAAREAVIEGIVKEANTKAKNAYISDAQTTMTDTQQNDLESIKSILGDKADDLMPQLVKLLNDKNLSDQERVREITTMMQQNGQSMMENENWYTFGLGTNLADLINEYIEARQILEQSISDADVMFKDAVEEETVEVQLMSASEQLSTARENYKAAQEEIKNLRDGTTKVEDPAKAIEDAQKKMNNAASQIKALSGKEVVDGKKIAENLKKLQETTAKEEVAIKKKAVEDKIALLNIEYEAQIKAIDKEEEAYNKQNGGGSAKSRKEFEKRRTYAKVTLQLDTEAAMREYEKFVESIEKNILSIQSDMELAELKQAIDLADDYNEKFEATLHYHEREIELLREKNKEERKNALVGQFGEQTTEALLNNRTSYTTASGEVVEISQDTINRFNEVVSLYAQLEQMQVMQSDQSYTQTALQNDYEDYMEYCEQVIEAAEWRQEQIRAIQDGESNGRTMDMVNADYNAMLESAAADHGIDATEQSLADASLRFANDIIGASYTQIDVALNALNEALDEQQQQIESVLNMSAEERAAEAQSLTGENQELETQLTTIEDETLRLQIVQQIAANQERINQLTMTDSQLTNSLRKVEQTRNTMATKAANAKLTAGKKSEAQEKKTARSIDVTCQGLAAVSDAAKMVANTFGGALSKKAKKALNAVADIADFGIEATQSILSVVQTVSKACIATGEAGAQSMSTIEKASVILTVISVAVQLISKIAEIASQFTTEAKMQDAIDEDIERVEELERKQEELETLYQSKAGTEYYQGMSAAAKGYTEVINAQKKAYEDAKALADYNATHYGEDSDKTKEAEEQEQDMYDALKEYEEEQRELFEELAADLLTTDLSSFASDLADTMVESFSEGVGGIEDAWSETLDELMKSMMKKGLSIAFENLFASTWEKMKAMTTDGTLTQSEMDIILAEMEEKAGQAKDIAETYYDAMEERGLLDDEDVEASSGGFESMSQDTADELNARFTALQMEGAGILATNTSILTVLSQIVLTSQLMCNSVSLLMPELVLGTQIAQSQLDQLRLIESHTDAIETHTARLKAIEINTNRL